jgi:cytoskeletal protein RodZ
MKNNANTETSLKPSKKKSNTKISIKTKIIGTIVPVVTILIVLHNFRQDHFQQCNQSVGFLHQLSVRKYCRMAK